MKRPSKTAARKPLRTKAPAKKRAYHHGDLRAALIAAAIAELSEHGVEGFTLRSCARRAGVSHAAPAHHFGDATGLLTAVATEAYRKLAASVSREVDGTVSGSIDHLVAVALGYVRFAVTHPGEFRVMFLRGRLNRADADLTAASEAAFAAPAGAIAAYYSSPDPMADPKLVRRVLELWSLSHGFADLMVAEQLAPLGKAMPVAAAVLPDLIREAFGVPALNRPQDLAAIAKATTAARPR
jgi:AcrR family transcriptional regulator